MSNYFPKILEKPSHMVMDLSRTSAPVIFIDNQPGYVPIETASLGRKSDGISWGNTKHCMGFTFFAQDEAIGAGIVKDGEIFAITSLRVEDFFNISFEGDETETSLIAVVQIDYDRILVCATSMYNGSAAYASAIVSARGLAVSLATKIEFLPLDIYGDTYSSYFDENGNASVDTTDPQPYDMIATYETYNGSTGFGFITSVRNAASKGGNATSELIDLVQRDIANLTSGFIPMQDAISIESAVHKEQVLIIAVSASGVSVNSYSGGSFSQSHKTFKTQSCLTNVDNVYQSRIVVVPPEKWAAPRYFSKIYAPPGVFARYNTFREIIISMPAGSIMNSYIIRPAENSSDIVDWSPCLEPGSGTLRSLEENDLGYSCDTMAFSLAGRRVFMNAGKALPDSIMATVDRIVATREAMGSASKAIRSMSIYIPYTSMK